MEEVCNAHALHSFSSPMSYVHLVYSSVRLRMLMIMFGGNRGCSASVRTYVSVLVRLHMRMCNTGCMHS